MTEFFAPGAFCAGCGKCCKGLPGGHLPDDFGVDLLEGVRSALASGRYALDWWEGDVAYPEELPRVLYLRPAVKGREGRLFHGAWGGECTFLTDAGCSLPRDKMPAECKALKPTAVPDGECPSGLIKEDLCLAWRPYQSLLSMIAAEVERVA